MEPPPVEWRLSLFFERLSPSSRMRMLVEMAAKAQRSGSAVCALRYWNMIMSGVGCIASNCCSLGKPVSCWRNTV